MKKNVLWIINISIFAVAYSSLFFYLVKDFSTTRMVSYSLIMLSYFAGPIMIFTTKAKDEVVHSYPKLFLSIKWFFIQFIVGNLFILINNDSPVFPIIVQLFIAVGFLIFITFFMIGEEATVASDKKKKIEFNFYKSMCNMSSSIEGEIQERNQKLLFEKIFDDIRSMQPIGSSATVEIESALKEAMLEVRTHAVSGTISNEDVLKVKKLCTDRTFIINTNKE